MKSDEETTMPKKTIENGLFVTFEGPEGSGKTTQIKMLAERLTEQEYEVVVTREPGGTILGEHIRKLLIEFNEEDIADEAELLLFGASRAQHMRRKILPCLKRGGIVLCDRFVDSTTAYQGYARKLDFGFIQNLHAFFFAVRPLAGSDVRSGHRRRYQLPADAQAVCQLRPRQRPHRGREPCVPYRCAGRISGYREEKSGPCESH